VSSRTITTYANAASQRPSSLSASAPTAGPAAVTLRIVPLLAAWALFFYLCYGVATAPRAPGGVVYNPFEILGLSDSSTEKQIKKHYKKLSLQLCETSLHPSLPLSLLTCVIT
jgi:translocation protein SEC63